MRTPNNWQWNRPTSTRSSERSSLEVGYVANYGYDLLKIYVANQVLNGDINGNGVDDRQEFVSRHRPIRRCASSACSATTTSASGITPASRRITRCRRSSSAAFRPRIAVPGVVHAGAFAGELRDDRQRSARREHRKAGQPEPRAGLGPARDRADPHLQLVDDLDAALARGHSRRCGRLGDWEVTAIVGGGTGQPMTVYTGSLPGLNGGPSGTGFNDNQRPNRASDEPCRASGGPDEQIINPAAYTLDGFRLARSAAPSGATARPGLLPDRPGVLQELPAGERGQAAVPLGHLQRVQQHELPVPGLDVTMDASAVTLNAARTEIASATVPSEFRPGDTHARPAPDADRDKAVVVS